MRTQVCFSATSLQLPSAAGTGCTAPEREAALHHESPGGRKTTATPEKLHTSSVFNKTQDRYPLGHGPWSYFLVVWSARGNTGLLGKKPHLRILLGMKIGFKRNNHHKCLISQIQLILLADFLFTSCTSWADSPQQGGTSLVFVSKVHLQGSTGPKLQSTRGKPVPWKLPAVIPQGPSAKPEPRSQALLSVATICAMKFPATPNILQCNLGTGRNSVPR